MSPLPRPPRPTDKRQYGTRQAMGVSVSQAVEPSPWPMSSSLTILRQEKSMATRCPSSGALGSNSRAHTRPLLHPLLHPGPARPWAMEETARGRWLLALLCQLIGSTRTAMRRFSTTLRCADLSCHLLPRRVSLLCALACAGCPELWQRVQHAVHLHVARHCSPVSLAPLLESDIFFLCTALRADEHTTRRCTHVRVNDAMRHACAGTQRSSRRTRHRKSLRSCCKLAVPWWEHCVASNRALCRMQSILRPALDRGTRSRVDCRLPWTTLDCPGPRLIALDCLPD